MYTDCLLRLPISESHLPSHLHLHLRSLTLSLSHSLLLLLLLSLLLVICLFFFFSSHPGDGTPICLRLSAIFWSAQLNSHLPSCRTFRVCPPTSPRPAATAVPAIPICISITARLRSLLLLRHPRFNSKPAKNTPIVLQMPWLGSPSPSSPHLVLQVHRHPVALVVPTCRLILVTPDPGLCITSPVIVLVWIN